MGLGFGCKHVAFVKNLWYVLSDFVASASFWGQTGRLLSTIQCVIKRSPDRYPQRIQSLLAKNYPERELTYPTLGKGKSSSKVPWVGDILVPRRVIISQPFSVGHFL